MTERAREPIYQKIQSFIQSGIENGHFLAGDKLPSEPELARQFSTTRATVQSALKGLEFQGVIVRRVGKGTFVAKPNIMTDLDTVRLLSFEEQMEEKGRRIEYRVVNFSHFTADESLCKQLGLQKGSRASRIVRLRILDGEPFSIEDRQFPHQISSRINLADLENFSIHRILQEKLSIRIGRIDVSIRAESALGPIANELGIKRGSPLLVREHRIVDSEGKTLLLGQSFYRQEFRFIYSNDPRRPDDPLKIHQAVESET